MTNAGAANSPARSCGSSTEVGGTRCSALTFCPSNQSLMSPSEYPGAISANPTMDAINTSAPSNRFAHFRWTAKPFPSLYGGGQLHSVLEEPGNCLRGRLAQQGLHMRRRSFAQDRQPD